jgi:hypothetical protein
MTLCVSKIVTAAFRGAVLYGAPVDRMWPNDRRDLHRWIHETGDLTSLQRTRSLGVMELTTKCRSVAAPRVILVGRYR